MKKAFITFEGPDGSGKTTIIKKIYQHLSDLGCSVLLTYEPGGANEICKEIRQILMKNGRYINKYAESLLFAASRAQHVSEIIKPALAANQIVLCDRFLDSSLVFQGFGKKIGQEKILMINDYFLNGFRPDLTIYLDLDPQIGIERINQNQQRKMNRMDEESLKMQREIHQGYLHLIKTQPERFFVVNASLDIDSIFKKVLDKILLFIGIENVQQK